MLIQISVPNRNNIPEYQRLKTEVNGLVDEINGKFGRPSWMPIQYIYRNLDRFETTKERPITRLNNTHRVNINYPTVRKQYPR